MRFIHWIAHRLGWNTGRVETFWLGSRLMVAFRCDVCGALQGAHECVIPPTEGEQ